MARQTLDNEHAQFTFRHRAVCEDDSFKGPWRDNVDLARQDAREHRQEPGNGDHVIRIVTEQSISLRYQEEKK
jgi:hypothetical protein